MKKIIVVLLTLLLIATFSLSTFAESVEVYTYEFGNVTVIFDQNSPLDAATRELVAHKLVYGDENVATYGFLCALLNHDYEESSASVITHCAQSMQPRCLEEFFNVQTCTRCDDVVLTRTGFRYITCCPNDA